MANCDSCNNSLAFFETLKTLVGTKRCNQCVAKFNQARDHWLSTMQQHFDREGVPADLEQALYRNFQEIRMPSDIAQPVIDRLKYLRHLSDIRWGNVPTIRTSHHLDSDEYARFEMVATYHKPAAKQTKLVPGSLLGTNKKLYFFSSTGTDNATIDWNNVGMVENMLIVETRTRKVRSNGRIINESYQTREQGVRLTVSKGSGGGAYIVADPLYTKTIMDTLVRLWKRQLVIYQDDKVHGAVPDHVKAAVHHRDNGTCRECGYTGEYIEYDHIIPRSKGGQNTVENIQILCGKCNKRKGDRL